MTAPSKHLHVHAENEYTPTTEEARNFYGSSAPFKPDADAAFDRWLAGVESAAERAGAAKALRILANECVETGWLKSTELRSRATEFESGEREL